ncbi:MAG: hypothetical protein AABW67_00645 [Nanoarchaeota archaeon]
MSEIDNIICAINPDRYCEGTKSDIQKFKTAIKKQGFNIALKKMKEFNLNPRPSSEHKLVYNSSAERLEPVYFWILDFIGGGMFKSVDKLVDNFAASPGSESFGELGVRRGQMQQYATKAMETVNAILRSALNLIYDLKEFKIRLSNYDEANSTDKQKSEAGNLALKQIWMDRVDVQRGAGSINGLASGNLQFVTIRDAFMMVNSEKDVDKLDLNERVGRILKPRIQEFNQWKKTSEQDLRKRFEIEKIYLKSQINALKLNTKWAKPYLKAAQQLEMNDGLSSNAALVSAFNTMIFELSIMGTSPFKVKDAVIDKDLPRDFAKMKKLRTYNSVVFFDFNFRGIPTRVGQGYVYGGKSIVTFKAYALNDEEIEKLKAKLSESDLNDSLKLISGMTDDSLAQLKGDIDELTEGKTEIKKEEENSDDNPFTALFDFFKSDKKEEETPEEKLNEIKKKKIKPDNYAEKYIRNFVEAKAISTCYTVFDVYKKAHGMASLPYMEEAEVEPLRTAGENLFGFKPNY